MPTEATHTAVVVAVPAAEPVVAEHRERFDPAASWGVPAHVTVLFPSTLTDAVWRAFPQHPPYGGAHPDVVPHLTVGQRPEATVTQLVAAERLLGPRLPVRADVDRVQLLAGTQLPGSWHVLHELTLAPAAGRPRR